VAIRNIPFQNGAVHINYEAIPQTMKFSNVYDIQVSMSRMYPFTHVIQSIFHARGCVQSPESPEQELILVLSVNFGISLALASTFGLVLLCTFSLLPEVSTALRCRPLLDSVLLRLSEGAPLLVKQKYWLQKDAVPAHYADNIWQWLNATSYCKYEAWFYP
jgi:hypothetical protein